MACGKPLGHQVLGLARPSPLSRARAVGLYQVRVLGRRRAYRAGQASDGLMGAVW